MTVALLPDSELGSKTEGEEAARLKAARDGMKAADVSRLVTVGWLPNIHRATALPAVVQHKHHASSIFS